MSSLDDSKSSDDSFIILGTSPGSSLDLKCEPVNGQPLNMKQMEDSIQDFSTEANMALKAHFKLGDSPSPASLMVASNMITEDMSLEDLQNRFGELLDENLILKETLKKNNDSMKEQFLMIASCQEDMVKTIKMQEDKFVEAKALVERLRQTNKRLKKEAEEFSRSAGSNGSKSGPSSAVEFVTSPDDDTINKLTSQLELVEKQRRQLIVENEKLTWQKESLEHIVDLTTKERDRLLKALHEAEIKISINEETHNNEISELKETAKTLRNQLIVSNAVTMPTEEVMVRETKIKNLEAEVNALQAANKESKLQILDLYNVKLEHTKFKSTSHEQCKIYKIQLEKLTSKLKEAQKVELKPVSLPKSLEPTSEGTIVEYNVRLYEKALKHLSEHLTNVNQGSLNSLRKIIDLMSTLYDYKLERIKEEGFKEVLLDAMAQFEKQQNHDVVHIENVKSALAVFEKIFTDYKKSLTASPQLPSQSTDLNALTIALLARGEEVDNLKMELRELQSKQDDMALLRAQIDTYKMDFEAERESREKMACEKATLEGRLRTSLQEVERLSSVLEMAIKKYPDIIQTMARSTFPTGSTRSTTREQSSNARDTMFKCPQCTYFKAKTQEEIFKHLDNCLGPSFCNPM